MQYKSDKTPCHLTDYGKSANSAGALCTRLASGGPARKRSRLTSVPSAATLPLPKTSLPPLKVSLTSSGASSPRNSIRNRNHSRDQQATSLRPSKPTPNTCTCQVE